MFTTAAGAALNAFEQMLAAVTYDRPFSADSFAADMRRIRARLEAERRRVVAGSRHLRFDPGGIMDVEFLTAFGQLAGGARDPVLRTTETSAALARLIATGWPAALTVD